MPASGCSLPGDHPEQRRLARAVRTDHADDAAARQREVHILHQQRVAVSLPHAPRLDHDVAEARAGRNVDLDLIDLLRRLFLQQIFVRVQARLALGLPRARRHADPVQLTRERPLPLRFGLLFDLQPLLLLLEPRRVVAFPRNPVPAIELENPAGDVVEKVTIVGDGDDGARVVLEEALEPGDRLGVEVVRRLVEQQQVRRLAAAAGRARRGAARRPTAS